ncbi:hypothetical protein [Ulvibacter antarcticus]|uniref:Uncharacterized protein n=1 Tax=Ulvibacter antarcticus TaxID=442714 RepID=A0A3L9ZB73_9FLAO|nr:hypothetical protein [Ulvibacter antarcticus]RMA67698.1 hypothetical protein BXY75_0008 [Ulvibacter antarcticus]
MVIKSNAGSSEISSPFYQMNEKFCAEFENYIASKNGMVKGTFNAFSYQIFGKISDPIEWELFYKKSTFTSGNLILSAKRQNLFVAAEWSTKRIGTHNSEFLIRRKTKSDYFKMKLQSNLSTFDFDKDYVIKSDYHDHQLITNLCNQLSELFDTKEIYLIEQKDDKLKIELRSEKHHFDIFEKLLRQ